MINRAKLEEWKRAREGEGSFACTDVEIIETIEALLRVKEAAEAYACECRELGADDTELYEAWRKSALDALEEKK